MVNVIRPHPRLCDICEGNAEKPYAALWDSSIHERVTLCSRWCLDRYKKEANENYIPPEIKRRKSV